MVELHNGNSNEFKQNNKKKDNCCHMMTFHAMKNHKAKLLITKLISLLNENYNVSWLKLFDRHVILWELIIYSDSLERFKD